MSRNFYSSLLTLCLLGVNCLISPSLYANKDFSVSGRRQMARAQERENAKSTPAVADNWENKNPQNPPQLARPNLPPPIPRNPDHESNAFDHPMPSRW